MNKEMDDFTPEELQKISVFGELVFKSVERSIKNSGLEPLYCTLFLWGMLTANLYGSGYTIEDLSELVEASYEEYKEN